MLPDPTRAPVGRARVVLRSAPVAGSPARTPGAPRTVPRTAPRPEAHTAGSDLPEVLRAPASAMRERL